ncbi:MAG TPA: VOC family protein [Thermoanaerobaculia bacterium]|nr:VOC family protein [Thermoanaerobaculia bacterium]
MTEHLFPILYARDLARTIRFYRDLLGMKESFRFPEEGEAVFVTLKWGSAELGIGTYDPTPGLEGRPLHLPRGGRGFELCVYVADVDAVLSRLRAEGVRVLVEPVDQPWGERLAYVEDPEGNTVMITASGTTGGNDGRTRG